MPTQVSLMSSVTKRSGQALWVATICQVAVLLTPGTVLKTSLDFRNPLSWQTIYRLDKLNWNSLASLHI